MPPYMYTEKQPCGTYPAYRRHLYRGEKPCDACAEARTAYQPPPKPRQYPVQVSLYPKIGPIARLLLGNELEWDGQPPYEWRREFLADWDGAA